MAEDIGEAAHARIEALLRDISVGHDLDDDTCDELRAHMEEKLLDYMHGEISITEQDAFVLVREHFGKPEVIRARFQESRQRFSLPLFARWCGAAVIAFASASLVEMWLCELTRLLFVVSWNTSNSATGIPYDVVSFMMEVPGILLFLAEALLLFAVLRAWRRGEEQGRRMWYHRGNLWQFAGLVIGLYVLAVIIGHWSPTSRLVMEFRHDFPMNAYHWGTDSVRYILRFAIIAISISKYSIMLWWFDRPPRKWNAPAGLVALFLFLSSSMVLRDILYVTMGWQSTAILARDRITLQFLDMVQYGVNQLFMALAGYLLVSTYPYIRRRVIATMKSREVFND